MGQKGKCTAEEDRDGSLARTQQEAVSCGPCVPPHRQHESRAEHVDGCAGHRRGVLVAVHAKIKLEAGSGTPGGRTFGWMVQGSAGPSRHLASPLPCYCAVCRAQPLPSTCPVSRPVCRVMCEELVSEEPGL